MSFHIFIHFSYVKSVLCYYSILYVIICYYTTLPPLGKFSGLPGAPSHGCRVQQLRNHPRQRLLPSQRRTCLGGHPIDFHSESSHLFQVLHSFTTFSLDFSLKLLKRPMFSASSQSFSHVLRQILQGFVAAAQQRLLQRDHHGTVSTTRVLHGCAGCAGCALTRCTGFVGDLAAAARRNREP